MEKILEKAAQYQYNAMEYTDAEDLEGAELIFDTEEHIFILKEFEDKYRVYWSAKSKMDFLEGLKRLSGIKRELYKVKPLYIEFVPEDFVEELENRGFKISSEFLDFWNKDLGQVNFDDKRLYKVRSITAEEYDTVSDITINCRNLSRGFSGENEEWVKEWSESENSITLGVEYDNTLAGVCFLNLYGFESEKGTVLWIREIAVEPKYHSKGLGRVLLKAAIVWGIEKGAKRSFLACDTENFNAIKLYESLGYKKSEGRGQINMIEV